MGVVRHSAILSGVYSSLQGGRSWVLRTYAIVGLVLIILSTVLIVLALPTWVAQTEGTTATLALGQALLVLAGLAVITAFFLPLYLATRRLPDPGEDIKGERLYGGFGYAIVLSIYLSLLISAPADARGEPPASIAPVIEGIYALDPIFALVPPVLVVVGLLLVDRHVGD